ncbi:TPA: helix-turn-helix domain-containing protein [Streptococcus suis]|uniref:helix-turn-helix domain-containing protein n=1 Tax=Streptococcus suis TaxID=1307 RepID=UPI000CF5C3C0|nr:helix-turn-helix domain-containing protein [Streptococcus suis]MDW8714407.1 helix-turn-helix domain-containing protein [Streptococcus suis]NQM33714.1 helix-turn-helix domain-containing protein [Streptococcus suis]HEM4261137.1 helix-turn-helix domain-containing protein [Streptococcus suis]HEM5942608.1 helix-turn-helix domain-containing protein [Streptococcus suis]HEM6055888.1 helix-turn-helix domain-containing protein [Streptococcus suis]
MNRLKELRKEKKLTQEELASEIGVSKITILRWENGERQIKPDKAKKLADYFGVPVGYLLGYGDDYYKQLAFEIDEYAYERFIFFLTLQDIYLSDRQIDNIYETIQSFQDSNSELFIAKQKLGEDDSIIDFSQTFGSETFIRYLEKSLLKTVETLFKDENKREKLLKAVFEIAEKDIPTEKGFNNIKKTLNILGNHSKP